MLTQTESHKISDTHSAQIEYVKTTLLNLETEVSIAQKNLKSLKSDTERAVKEKIYQEECLAEIQSQVTVTKREIEILHESKRIIESDIQEKIELSKSFIDDQAIKSQTIEEREAVISSKEKTHAEKVADFTVQSAELEKEKRYIQNAKEILKNAIESI